MEAVEMVAKSPKVDKQVAFTATYKTSIILIPEVGICLHIEILVNEQVTFSMTLPAKEGTWKLLS